MRQVVVPARAKRDPRAQVPLGVGAQTANADILDRENHFRVLLIGCFKQLLVIALVYCGAQFAHFAQVRFGFGVVFHPHIRLASKRIGSRFGGSSKVLISFGIKIRKIRVVDALGQIGNHGLPYSSFSFPAAVGIFQSDRLQIHRHAFVHLIEVVVKPGAQEFDFGYQPAFLFRSQRRIFLKVQNSVVCPADTLIMLSPEIGKKPVSRRYVSIGQRGSGAVHAHKAFLIEIPHIQPGVIIAKHLVHAQYAKVSQAFGSPHGLGANGPVRVGIEQVFFTAIKRQGCE